MSIKKNLELINSSLPDDITLVAVSKTKPVEVIMEAYDAGHYIFGENKIQEMVDKYENLPKDIQWHMIGHVQSNKVKYMASFVHMIHGVDSLKLLKEINKQAKKHQRVIECLFQIKIAKEESKFGMTVEEISTIIDSISFMELENIKIVGVMGMATFTDNQDQIKEEFLKLKSNFDHLKTFQSKNYSLSIISMGMSADYHLAIDCGSTMVRIGSHIFGERNYN
jgi:hypothetical protein